MSPTLRNGQDIISFNWAYLFQRPRAGDLVVIKYQGKEIIKRIQKVDNRGIFIIGDNPTQSIDSRSFGPIDKNQIVGKVIY